MCLLKSLVSSSHYFCQRRICICVLNGIDSGQSIKVRCAPAGRLCTVHLMNAGFWFGVWWLGVYLFFCFEESLWFINFSRWTVLHAIAESTVLACIKRHKVYHNKSSRGKNWRVLLRVIKRALTNPEKMVGNGRRRIDANI